MNKFRTALAKLRLFLHRLEVETGIWARPNAIPFSERLCKVCNKLEDEYYFVLECSIYLDLRKSYVNRYYCNRPRMFKLNYLIQQTKNK